mmetsp:Transcript_29294/g.73586  ORF Transcript_29294/g.73586 Transcript_29294/m.73586 type:complete len:224 (-) Transcript_29294:223-894(-)
MVLVKLPSAASALPRELYQSSVFSQASSALCWVVFHALLVQFLVDSQASSAELSTPASTADWDERSRRRPSPGMSVADSSASVSEVPLFSASSFARELNQSFVSSQASSVVFRVFAQASSAVFWVVFHASLVQFLVDPQASSAVFWVVFQASVLQSSIEFPASSTEAVFSPSPTVEWERRWRRLSPSTAGGASTQKASTTTATQERRGEDIVMKAGMSSTVVE